MPLDKDLPAGPTKKARHQFDEGVLTDDLSYDDIVCASEELKVAIQTIAHTYDLEAPQLRAALKLALEGIKPGERLFAAIDGTLHKADGTLHKALKEIQ